MNNMKILSKSENLKQEYCCSIIKVGTLKPIEGSDFLAQTFIGDASIVVRKDQVNEGDLMFYASNECQLNEKFLSANNLFDIGCYEKNGNAKEVRELLEAAERCEAKLGKDYTPEQVEILRNERDAYKAKAKAKCGFFPHNGRVRMIRLKKTPSMGYLFSKDEMAKYCPKVKDINMEEYLNIDFDTVDGELFVKAYVPPIKEHGRRGGKQNKRDKKVKQFDRIIEWSFHYDTDMLAKNIWKIRPDDVVTISNKLHGCVERNTIVDTLEFGKKKIGDIVDNKIDCHIKSFDTDNEEIVYVPIDAHYMVPEDGEWYEIELEDGRKITITGNNPVWIPELNAYKRVDELNGDESLLID